MVLFIDCGRDRVADDRLGYWVPGQIYLCSFAFIRGRNRLLPADRSLPISAGEAWQRDKFGSWLAAPSVRQTMAGRHFDADQRG